MLSVPKGTSKRERKAGDRSSHLMAVCHGCRMVAVTRPEILELAGAVTSSLEHVESG